MPRGISILTVIILLPAIEIAGFVIFGSAYGVLATLLATFATAVMGAWIIKRQGFALIRQIQGQMQRQEQIEESIAGIFFLYVAAILLIIPGFFSDLVGLALLVTRFRQIFAGYLLNSKAFRSQHKPNEKTDEKTIELGADEWQSNAPPQSSGHRNDSADP